MMRSNDVRKMLKTLVGPVVASAAAAALLAGSATAASAAATLDAHDTAALVAKGAAVTVRMDVACDPTGSFFPPTAFVTLTQRSANRIAEGEAVVPVTCDGATHTVEALITAVGVPFKVGTALVNARLSVCDFTGCETATDISEVRIRH
jgi:hypothetical protein